MPTYNWISDSSEIWRLGEIPAPQKSNTSIFTDCRETACTGDHTPNFPIRTLLARGAESRTERSQVSLPRRTITSEAKRNALSKNYRKNVSKCVCKVGARRVFMSNCWRKRLQVVEPTPTERWVLPHSCACLATFVPGPEVPYTLDGICTMDYCQSPARWTFQPDPGGRGSGARRHNPPVTLHHPKP